MLYYSANGGSIKVALHGHQVLHRALAVDVAVLAVDEDMKVITIVYMAVAGLAATFTAGCQTASSGKVKVVGLADACVTNGFVMARRTNTDALSAAGYIPMLIPQISDTNLLAQTMDRVDALLLTGGVKGQDYPNRIAFEKLLMKNVTVL